MFEILVLKEVVEILFQEILRRRGYICVGVKSIVFELQVVHDGRKIPSSSLLSLFDIPHAYPNAKCQSNAC